MERRDGSRTTNGQIRREDGRGKGRERERERWRGVGAAGAAPLCAPRALLPGSQRRPPRRRTALHVDLLDGAVALEQADDVALLGLVLEVADEDLRRNGGAEEGALVESKASCVVDRARAPPPPPPTVAPAPPRQRRRALARPRCLCDAPACPGPSWFQMAPASGCASGACRPERACRRRAEGRSKTWWVEGTLG